VVITVQTANHAFHTLTIDPQSVDIILLLVSEIIFLPDKQAAHCHMTLTGM
jgi:hypothetical protein